MNEQEIRQQIDELLAHLDEQQTSVTGKNVPPATDEAYQRQPRIVIEVYVIEREPYNGDDEDPQTVESTIASPQSQECQDHEDQGTTKIHIASQRPRLYWLAIMLIALCILTPGIASLIYVLPLVTPSATITLVTQSQQLTTTSTLQVVNGAADSAQHQLAGRVLPKDTMSQGRTIPTTGTAHQDAKAAYGLLTFYNAASYVQTINVGTMLTGADGIPVITDQNAVIPAAVMPTEGQVTVSAHAALTGPLGNIRAGDLYGQCCRLNVFVANSAFHGGMKDRSYHTVTQQDITIVASNLTASLDQSVQAAFQTQVHPTETLLMPLSCTHRIISDHRPGEEAIKVNVTLDETCTGIVYNAQALTTLVTQIVTQGAMKRLGAGYTPTGVQTSVTQATNNHGGSDLQVKSVSLWTHSFTQTQQQVIKAMIAGTSKDRATAILLHTAGVQSVFITLKNGSTIPNDVQHINLVFLRL